MQFEIVLNILGGIGAIATIFTFLFYIKKVLEQRFSLGGIAGNWVAYHFSFEGTPRFFISDVTIDNKKTNLIFVRDTVKWKVRQPNRKNDPKITYSGKVYCNNEAVILMRLGSKLKETVDLRFYHTPCEHATHLVGPALSYDYENNLIATVVLMVPKGKKELSEDEFRSKISSICTVNEQSIRIKNNFDPTLLD